MEDVFKVLTDLDDDFAAEARKAAAVGAGTSGSSVVDSHHVVDKVALANEQLSALQVKQDELERRYLRLGRRLDLMRLRHLGRHTAEELTAFRERAEEVVPAAPLPPVPKIDPYSLPKAPVNVPDGVVLPSVPSTEVLHASKSSTSITTTVAGSSAASSSSLDPPALVIKDESRAPATEERPAPVEPFTGEERDRLEEVISQLECNLKHLTESYDSDATESSSGGESADESEPYPDKNQDYAPVRRRAHWGWLSARGAIASKWTWLTAQISDLEYRIRQQTEFYRQIRAAKGGVQLGEPTVSWPPHARKAVQGQVRPDHDVPLNCKPVTKDYSRTDASGRKIIIKEPPDGVAAAAGIGGGDTTTAAPALPPAPPLPPPASSVPSDSDDGSFGACRTRPVKMVRRRRILSTKGLYRAQARAAKESSVRCDCIQSLFDCSICFGRLNHTQAPDPITQDRNQCMALLDHSYHQVLSTVEDPPLDQQFAQRLKSRTWTDFGDGAGEATKKRMRKTKKEDEEKAGGPPGAGSAAAVGSESASAEAPKKKRLKVIRKNKDGKKLTGRRDPTSSSSKKRRPVVHHHSDDRSSFINDLSDDGEMMMGDSPVPSPSVPSSNQAWADHIRRKRETAYDIDNIVIPYSIAAATRVERIKYKEIMTPTWRNVSAAANAVSAAASPSSKETTDEPAAVATTTKANEESSSPCSSTAASAADPPTEDIGDVNYELRHAKAELEEKRRWALPLWNKTSGGQRTRNRRQDSCRTEASSGCNTPDPLSPGMVEKVDTLEVNTRPSTPTGGSSSAAAAAASGNNAEDNAPTTPLTAASIRNRRRTSSATKSRDRNPSEDASQSSRCTTPTQEQQQQHLSQDLVEVVPFEPRDFPLSEDAYSAMLAEMPCEADVSVADSAKDGGGASADVGGKRRGSAGGGPSHNGALSSPPEFLSPAHSSSGEEDTEEDPDWKCDQDDRDDPEWSETGGAGNGQQAAGNGAAAGNSKSGSHAAAGGQHSNSKKGAGLTLKMPPKR